LDDIVGDVVAEFGGDDLVNPAMFESRRWAGHLAIVPIDEGLEQVDIEGRVHRQGLRKAQAAIIARGHHLFHSEGSQVGGLESGGQRQINVGRTEENPLAHREGSRASPLVEDGCLTKLMVNQMIMGCVYARPKQVVGRPRR